MDTILSGIITGLVASIIFAGILMLIRPKISVSNKICKRKLKNGDFLYCIKIVNRSRFLLTDVKCCLEYCTPSGSGNKRVTEIEPKIRKPIMYIDKYTRKNEDYALRMAYEIDNYPISENSYYIFTIQAKHSISNTVRTKRVIYNQYAIQEGIFETGKSMKILST